MNDEVVSDPNFDHRAQAAFDNLNDATDWTWSGLAEAFAKRYGRADLVELRMAIDAMIDASDDLEDFDVGELR